MIRVEKKSSFYLGKPDLQLHPFIAGLLALEPRKGRGGRASTATDKTLKLLNSASFHDQKMPGLKKKKKICFALIALFKQRNQDPNPQIKHCSEHRYR